MAPSLETERLLLRFAFRNVGLDRVYAGADPPNETSFGVLHGLEADSYVVHAP